MNISLPLTLIGKHFTRAIILLCLSTSCLFAQNTKIDSLKLKLVSTPESESFEINFQLAREFTYVDNKIALDFVRAAKVLAYQKKDSLNIVRSLRLTGQVNRRLDNLDSSIYYFLKGLPIAARNNFSEEQSAMLNGVGIVYIYLSKFDQALSYLMQSLALYEKSSDKLMISVVENNIGLVYFKLDDCRTALEHFNRSLSLKRAINDNFDIETLIINISLCYIKLNNLREAREILNTVIKNCPTKCDDKIFVEALYASGRIWFESDSLRNAEKDFLKSYTIATRTNNQRFIFDCINGLSQIYLRENNLLLAEKFLTVGEKMIQMSDFDGEEMTLFKYLCSFYRIKGNYQKLSFYNEKYIQMNDSIYAQDKANNLMRLHAESEEKENKNQLASQEQSLQLKEEIINKQLGINILIGITLVLLGILIYVLIKILVQRKEANSLLNKKVKERSDELLLNHEKLKLALEQRDMALAKLNSDFSNSIESMRTLCLAGTKTEMDINAQRYFDEINITTLNLSNSLNNILSESKVA